MILVSEHRTIKLPDGLDFFTWAHQRWPARWSAELDPWQLVSAGRDDLSCGCSIWPPYTRRASGAHSAVVFARGRASATTAVPYFRNEASDLCRAWCSAAYRGGWALPRGASI
jgi:hypothetical protein